MFIFRIYTFHRGDNHRGGGDALDLLQFQQQRPHLTQSCEETRVEKQYVQCTKIVTMTCMVVRFILAESVGVANMARSGFARLEHRRRRLAILLRY